MAFCFCFLVGVAVASLVDVHGRGYVFWIALIFVSGAIVWWANARARFAVLCLFFIFLGFVRYSFVFPRDRITESKVTITGFVSAEPDVRMDGVRYIISVTDITKGDVKIPGGNIYVKSNLYPRYNYGDVLSVSCLLQAPEPIEDFRYDMYLARYGVFAICVNPYMEPLGNIQGSGFFRVIYLFKSRIAERINILWHEPHASFMAGLLYGYRGGLGSLNDLFSRTGVTHIVAISGYNITIVSTILSSILVSVYVPRKKAFYIILAGISVFVIFAGLSASVVRAGIMGCIVLLARRAGLGSHVGNVLMLTAVIMIAHNPLILMWDAGFQLSFISTLGLVYVSTLLPLFFKKIPEHFGLRESMEATLSATIATLPLILFQFKRLSIVAIPVNVLILWIIPMLMFLGFVAVILSVVYMPLAYVVSYIAWCGLTYIIIVVKWFASLYFAAVDIKVPWWGMVLMYLILFYIWYRKNKKK